MKIKYEYVNETVEIEVDEKWAAVLEELDRQEYNNEHAETRRHASHSHGDDGKWMIEDEDIETKYVDSIDAEKMMKIAKEHLKDSQLELFIAISYKGYGLSDYAREINTSRQNVHDQYQRALKKIKKYLKNA